MWWTGGGPPDTPAVLSTKTGRLQLTAEVVCVDTDTLDPDARAAYLARLDRVLRTLDQGWALEADWWHTPAVDYPVTEWDATGAPLSDRLVDHLRRLDFETHPHHASTLYLTLSWQPPSPARHLLQGLLTTKGLARRVQHTVEENLALFLEGTTRFLGFLRPPGGVGDAPGCRPALHVPASVRELGDAYGALSRPGDRSRLAADE